MSACSGLNAPEPAVPPNNDGYRRNKATTGNFTCNPVSQQTTTEGRMRACRRSTSVAPRGWISTGCRIGLLDDTAAGADAAAPLIRSRLSPGLYVAPRGCFPGGPPVLPAGPLTFRLRMRSISVAAVGLTTAWAAGIHNNVEKSFGRQPPRARHRLGTGRGPSSGT